MGRIVVWVVLVVLGTALAGCSEPLEFADWTIPVPEQARIIDYPAVPVDGRTERIGLEEISRVGAGRERIGLEETSRVGAGRERIVAEGASTVGAGDDMAYSFYHPTDLAVADDGRLYVLDAGNHRIQAFDAEGMYLTSISREGDGPGEIRRGGEIVVGSDVLVRVGDGRISTWTLDGELITDASIVDGASAPEVAGLPDGSVVAILPAPSPDDDGSTVISSFVRVGAEGEPNGVYARLRGAERALALMSDSGLTIVNLPTPSPGVAVSRRGELYLTNADEYQILAMDAEGEARWALRTAWPRLPMSAADKDRAVARRVDETATEDLDVAWPTHNPALANGRAGEAALHVDGHGHLYVFPFVRADADAPQASGPWPVDVYAADGVRLFTGLIGVPGWWDAAGDFIYRFENDAATQEQVVVRSRLVEPFERP